MTVDTATLTGSFETNSVVYPEASRQFLDVIKYDGLELKVGAKIASTGNVRFGISIISSLATFQVGNRLYKIANGTQDLNTYAIITGVDIGNNFIYAQEFQGTLTNGDQVGDYGVGSFPQGYANITTKVVTAGSASATVQDVKTVGTLKRVYLSDVAGVFDVNDAIKSIDSSVIEIHITNTFARDDFRHVSYITPVAKGLIVGFGLDSYRMAVESVLN